MVKRMVLVRRRAGLTREQFADHWLGVHALLAREMPHLVGYRLNVVLEWEDPDLADAWDGIGELWFDTQEQMREAFALFRPRLAPDLAVFVGHVATAIVDEHIIEPAPAT